MGPSDYEQYLLELVNRGRANPTAEAARYGIDLNEGLVPGTISSDPKQPLALNLNLIDAARGHSQWMLDNDVFSHTGAGGSSPGDRMTAAGYDFLAPWGYGENVAWYGTMWISPDPLTTTADLHEALFVDETIAGRGHRRNLMNASSREVGLGILFGEFQGYNAEMITQDFAYTNLPDSDAFLTGVLYNDQLVTQDSFYTPGEGLGGATVTATRTTDGATFSTTTWSSGGYSLPLPTGTYNVTVSGAGLPTDIIVPAVQVGSSNVKLDFTPAQTLAPVYRFWSKAFSGHFYTTSAAERDKLINDPGGWWAYEGPAYYAYAPGQQPAGTVPVYRFWSSAFRGHFYTASEAERNAVNPNFWTYERIAYYVYPVGQVPAGTAAVYRFWSATFGHHFYTISATERNTVLTNWPWTWADEGEVWYTYAA